MGESNFVVEFKDKKYSIDKEKLQEVISRFENKELILKDYKEIKKYLNKYKLYDEIFLKRMGNN